MFEPWRDYWRQWVYVVTGGRFNMGQWENSWVNWWHGVWDNWGSGARSSFYKGRLSLKCSASFTWISSFVPWSFVRRYERG